MMMKKFLSASAFIGPSTLALFLCIRTAARSQSETRPSDVATLPARPTYRLGVKARIVVLDVVISDKQGHLVHKSDLSRDDFAVFEDGVQQSIRSFEPPAQHAMPQSDKPVVNSAADLQKIGDAPVTILVLDELNSQFQDMSYARQMMTKYLQSQTQVLKQPTALMIASNAKFVQVHDYTQNRDELIEIVKKHMPEYPWRAMGSTGGGALAVERMAQTLAALQQLAQAGHGTRGQKNVIWVGNGMPTVDTVGIDVDHAQIITNAVRAVTAKLLASRVTVYTINPMAGSSSTVDVETPDDLNTAAAKSTGMSPFGSSTLNFTDFAVSTGGLSFQGRNDLNNVIAEGISRGNEYYTLSYSPTNRSDDTTKFRRISIVMKDRNLRATTRAGYFEDTAADTNPMMDDTLTAKQKQHDLQLDLSQALNTTMTYNGLQVSAKAGVNRSYNVHVDESGLIWSEPTGDGSEHAEVTVAAAWYDRDGKMLSHVVREEIALRGRAAGADFSLQPIDTKVRWSRMRIVVRDALGGQLGTADVLDK
jgi:VWFA-related protein